MTGSCNNFVNVELQIRPTCEIPSETSYPYQYGGIYINGSYAIDYSNVITTLTSVSSFSVSWKPSSATSASTSADTIDSTRTSTPSISTLFIMIMVVQALILFAAVVYIYVQLRSTSAKCCLNHEGKVFIEKSNHEQLYKFYDDKDLKLSQSNNEFSTHLRSFKRKSSIVNTQTKLYE